MRERKGIRRLAVSVFLAAACVARGEERQPRPEAVVIRPPQVTRPHRDSLARGLRYLASRQQPSGSIGDRYRVAVTSLAGLAFLAAGNRYNEGPHGDVLRGCLHYVLKVAEGSPDGYVSDRESRMHGHGFALLFLSQVFGELPRQVQGRVQDVIRRGIRLSESAQSKGGGWTYSPDNWKQDDEASITVCVLQALRAANNSGFHVTGGAIARALEYLCRCQNRDGSFRYSISRGETRSSFALTAAAVSSLNAIGVYHSREVDRGLGYLKEVLAEHEGRPLDASANFRFYGSYYAAQAFYQAGGEVWSSWYPRARDQLIQEQSPSDGRWTSPYGDEYATAMAVLILEIPYQYLPIFQR